jgi:hypothetical protein
MSPRFVPVMLGTAAFIVTLGLAGWHQGLWERPAEPPASVTQIATPVPPAPRPTAGADLPLPVPPEARDPASATAPVSAPADIPEDAADPAASEPQREQHGRQAERGARTR